MGGGTDETDRAWSLGRAEEEREDLVEDSDTLDPTELTEMTCSMGEGRDSRRVRGIAKGELGAESARPAAFRIGVP